MEYSNQCEACSVSVHLSKKEIDALFIRTVDVENVTIVDEEEYTRRTNICMSCEALLYNTTCRYCGCIVQIKARIEQAACPYPYHPKW